MRSSDMLMPKNRRKFFHVWHEISYLYDKANYWLNIKGNRKHSEGFMKRLASLISTHDPDGKTVIGADSLVLLAAFDGDIEQKIISEEHYISVLSKLLSLGPCPDYNWLDIVDSLYVVASLYLDKGSYDLADSTVSRAKEIVGKHQIPIDVSQWKKELFSTE